MKLTLPRHKTRIVKKTVPTESFFNFFSPPKAPSEDDDDAASDIEERLELDYQLGEDIKEKLIPRAIDWFTGEALAFEEMDEEDFDEEDFDEDDDEEDLSDDRDEDEESDEDDVRTPPPKTPHLLDLSWTSSNVSQDEDGSKPKQEAAECKQS
jgi:nucleosome assembly protein 1-like 1